MKNVGHARFLDLVEICYSYHDGIHSLHSPCTSLRQTFTITIFINTNIVLEQFPVQKRFFDGTQEVHVVMEIYLPLNCYENLRCKKF